MNNRRSCIKLQKLNPIGIHFNSVGHTQDCLEVLTIELLNTQNSSNTRKTREYYWQFTPGTIFPRGLNGFPGEHKALFDNVEIRSVANFDKLWNHNLLNNS